MNRCMYSSNYQNQMINSCNRPMQRPDACRPANHSDGCRPSHHSDNCHPSHTPGNCHPSQRPAPCQQDPCAEARRPMQGSNSCSPVQKADGCKQESCSHQPKYTRSQMLQYINEVSFAVNDILLYLDTHPCDMEAIEFYRKNVEKRNAALCDFAKFYGPLTVDTADQSQNSSWEWVMQPWPWVNGS